MCAISINVPEEVLLDLHENQSDFTEYMQRTLALDLYKNKKVALGYCSSVAGMTKEEFVKYLGINGVSIFSFDSEEDFMEELANA
jgi:predicted HTH domain antitoxin